MEKETRQNLVLPFRVLPAALFGLANALFFMKYSSRVVGLYGVPAGAYLLFVLVSLFLFHGTLDRIGRQKAVFTALAFAFAAAVILAMRHVAPSSLNVDRFSAIAAFDDNLIHGRFPYAARTHLGHPVSGFPGLFLLLLPFHLLGDPGYFQIPAFLLFCLLAWRTDLSGGKKTALLLLAGTAPIFLWECMVRSELFGNMALLIAALLWLEGKRGKGGLLTAAAAGLLAGLFLSTRGIVLVPLMLYFIRFLKGRGARSWVVCLGAAAATAAIIFLPFYFWDPTAFLANNPFKIQSGYIPSGLLLAVLLLTALLGFTIRTWDGFLLTSGYILFGTIAVVFCLNLLETGFSEAVFKSGFDLSYFQFSAPFLLLSMFRPESAAYSAITPITPAESGASGPVRS
jgi:hypothetical protein